MARRGSSHPQPGWLPGVVVLRGYERRWLRGDLLAGVTVAAYLVPQVMAYAALAGLPAVTGLWAAMAAGLVYALVGSSRQLSVGPEATTALMTGAALGGLAVGDPGRRASLAATLCLLVALLCLIAWLAGLARVADLLSKPVLVGYLAGISVIMVSGQLTRLTGVPVEGDRVVSEVASFLDNLHLVHGPTLAVGLGTLALLVVGGRMLPTWPTILLGMLAVTAVVAGLGLQAHGVHVVGSVPAGLPAPSLPSLALDDLRLLLGPALGLAFVAYSDNILTARAFADRNGYAIDPRQELVGLGAANLASGLMHGFPVSSSGSRTAIGDALGSRTPLSSLTTVAATAVVLLLLRPVLGAFPTAALGAVVVYAALRLIDLAEFRRLADFRRSEIVLALATTAAVLVVGVLLGVLVAIGLSILDLLRRVARPHDAVQGLVPGLAGMHDVDDYPDAQVVPGLLVYRYDSPLFFANAADFQHRALASVEASQAPVEWFVLNTEANVEVDVTALDALEGLRAELARRGITFALARLKQDLRDELAPSGLLERIGEDRIFATLPTAVAAFQARDQRR